MQSDYSGQYFQSRFMYDPARDLVWREIGNYLRPYIPLNSQVLDIGAGYCSFINNIIAEKRYAIDLYPDFVSHAAPGVKTFVGSCADLSMFSDGELDVVFASNLLEHLSRDILDSTLHEILRVLKSGGRIILLQPNFRYAYREYFDDYTHIQVFTHISLADLLSARNFELVKVHPRFLPFSFKSRLPKWRFLVRFYLSLPVHPMAKQMLLIAQKK